MYSHALPALMFLTELIETMELKRVVVTGLGAVTPVGNTPEETWTNLLAGKSGAAPITQFDTTNFKTHFACEVKGLNVNDSMAWASAAFAPSRRK